MALEKTIVLDRLFQFVEMRLVHFVRHSLLDSELLEIASASSKCPCRYRRDPWSKSPTVSHYSLYWREIVHGGS